jgi:hypothetical protein
MCDQPPIIQLPNWRSCGNSWNRSTGGFFSSPNLFKRWAYGGQVFMPWSNCLWARSASSKLDQDSNMSSRDRVSSLWTARYPKTSSVFTHEIICVMAVSSNRQSERCSSLILLLRSCTSQSSIATSWRTFLNSRVSSAGSRKMACIPGKCVCADAQVLQFGEGVE